MDSESKEKPESQAGTILEEMVIKKAADSKDEKAGLLAPGAKSNDPDNFAEKVNTSLLQTEKEVLAHSGIAESDARAKSWQTARSILSRFRPVPWFIWRLCNYSIGTVGEVQTISDGMVFGLRRLMYAAASDPHIGCGQKVNDVHKALKTVPSDVIAAVAVMHAVSRRLAASQFERIWRPILDDALIRARIGFLVGQHDPSFAAGRAMLAGYSGRCGLAILVASGELEEARTALEMLAVGEQISKVGQSIYGCDPLEISAMLLIASGCGRDAAYGTASFAQEGSDIIEVSSVNEAQKWKSALSICEFARIGAKDRISDSVWNALGIRTEDAREKLLKECKLIVRRGHDWNWIG